MLLTLNHLLLIMLSSTFFNAAKLFEILIPHYFLWLPQYLDSSDWTCPYQLFVVYIYLLTFSPHFFSIEVYYSNPMSITNFLQTSTLNFGLEIIYFSSAFQPNKIFSRALGNWLNMYSISSQICPLNHHLFISQMLPISVIKPMLLSITLSSNSKYLWQDSKIIRIISSKLFH
jgi:hypothetical protein